MSWWQMSDHYNTAFSLPNRWLTWECMYAYMGSRKSLVSILWAPCIPVPNVIAIHPIVVEPTDQHCHPLALLAYLTTGIVWKPHQGQMMLHLKYHLTTISEGLQTETWESSENEIHSSQILYKTQRNNTWTTWGLNLRKCVMPAIFS